MIRYIVGVALTAAMAMPILAADKGADLYRDKKYAEAERALREEIQAEPQDTEANYYLGLALLEQEKYKDSEPYLKKALGEKPAAHLGLARAYMMQDKLKEALSELKSVEKQEENNPELYRSRGMILLKQNQFKDSAAQLSKAIELDPKDAYAHYYYAMANSRLKRPDLMIKHFQFFLELAPEAPEAEKVRSLLRSL